ncbi:MAG: hypothetical protein R3B54_09850 [Bdellovibrionota bacterium]
MDFVKLALALILISACGEHLPVERRSGRESVQPASGQFLSEVLPTTDEKSIDLASFAEKPLIIIFAEETCLTCLKEAKGFIAYLNAELDGTAPNSVQLLHVLVGIEDPWFAQEWKRNTGIVWPVAYEPAVVLKNKLCGKGPLPCTLIQLPKRGLGEPHIGLVTAEKLIQKTGKWE